MPLNRLERETAYWVISFLVLCTCLCALGIIHALKGHPAVASLEVKVAPVRLSQGESGFVTEALPALGQPKAQLITVATVARVSVPVTYEYPIPINHTLTRIQTETCNPIDDILRRNQGNPAIKSRDTIIAGGVITLLKVESCSPVMVKAKKAFPENNPRLADRGGSPEASVASGPHERQARKERVTHTAPLTLEHATPVKVAGMSRRQMYELANDNCAAAGWGKKHASTDWTVAIADCIEEKWGKSIRVALHEQQAAGRIPEGELEAHARRFVALVIVESSGNPLAKSVPLAAGRDPCYGLTQIQPGTGRVFGLPFHEIYNPHKNILTGVRVLYDYAYDEKFGGSMVHGLVAYNIGVFNKAWNFTKFRLNADKFPYALDVERTRLVLERAAAARKPKEPLLDDRAESG